MKQFKHDIIYFIGIGGIGMSALARWFNANQYKVIGYDKTASFLTSELENEGIEVHFEENESQIPVEASPSNTLVIYTPAIPKNHIELTYFKKNGFMVMKRAEVLGEISKHHFTVAVAGTHGKTTTSSMIVHMLHSAGIDVTGFIGGIATNFNSNLVIGRTDKAIAVVEADEFDKSFLQLSPNIAIITSADADHLDIYGNANELKDTFKEFITKLEKDGQLLISKKANESLGLNQGIEYGLKGRSAYASNLKVDEGAFEFDFIDEDRIISGLKLFVPGYHNVENAIAAIETTLLLGVTPAQVKRAVTEYKGVKRRFEFVFNSEQKVFIDDYAHHPEEIRAFIRSAKTMYPEKRLMVIFQPHLYSRTKDFAVEFASALDEADMVWVMDVYPAREQPMEGVNAELILNHMLLSSKGKINRYELIDLIETSEFDVLATLGAGDIDRMVPEIKKMLLNKYSHA